uniref:CSON004541 protein n=1 Tax=Culicoides sonorensis TaxID=179676 RepID=A0A336LF82_CULSO
MSDFISYVEQTFADVNNVMIFSVVLSIVTTIIFMRKCYKSDSTKTTEESNPNDETSSDDENESDEETAGIYSRLKAAKLNKLRSSMTEDQLKAEKEIEQQQLAAIFELLKKQQEELKLAGEDVAEIDIKEQLSLYR